jgi:hypothetical protein
MHARARGAPSSFELGQPVCLSAKMGSRACRDSLFFAAAFGFVLSMPSVNLFAGFLLLRGEH